ncbi:MAG TPA: creatininase family protein [Phycisphaerae bacterium]|nr:creatininase family protein [Phycisphaerae bacterium]HRY67917.1 creatininase family protein [Phycisphaerae bacterium]HSA26076.1 creatininase family protein [Phycisphaerae bacterium]
MLEEVRYYRLRPWQVVAAREACPVAYVPLGTTEWHGPHMPLGADTVMAECLAERCTREGGGLVLPSLAWGESRLEGLMDAHAPDYLAIHAEMKLPSAGFTAAAFRYGLQEQYENYQRLLLHMLCEIQSLGFKVGVLIAGHYPLIDHARAALGIFHQMRFNGSRARMVGWTFTGPELIPEEIPQGGDHAGFWETSMMLGICPEVVDMNRLPPGTEKPTGTLTTRPIQEADAQFGKRAVDLIVQRAIAAVRDRLDNPKAYYAHGLRV